jgi:ribosome assembly protein RRB1
MGEFEDPWEDDLEEDEEIIEGDDVEEDEDEGILRLPRR